MSFSARVPMRDSMTADEVGYTDTFCKIDMIDGRKLRFPYGKTVKSPYLRKMTNNYYMDIHGNTAYIHHTEKEDVCYDLKDKEEIGMVAFSFVGVKPERYIVWWKLGIE